MNLSSVLVYVSGEMSDDSAVKLACELLNLSKTKLYILYVVEVERALPLDAEIAPATAKGEEVLNHTEKLAGRYKCETQADNLQARQAGYAIVQEAVDKHVDAIVLAVPYTTRHGSFTIGQTVPYVLEHAPCKVILWREDMTSARGSNGGPNP